MSKVNKIALISSLVGVGILVVVIISGASYPDPLYSYGTAIGMLMVFVSMLLYVASWCHELFVSIKEKAIIDILVLIITAIFFVVLFVKR